MNAWANLVSTLVLFGLIGFVMYLHRRVSTLEGHQWQWRFSGGKPQVWDNPAGRWREPSADDWRTLTALTGLARHAPERGAAAEVTDHE